MPAGHHYREYQPGPLRPYVECYWQARSAGSPGFRPLELLVPDLKIELVIIIRTAGEGYGWAAEPGGTVRPAPLFGCIGMRGVSVPIQQSGRLDHFAIRFRPGGLAAFVGLPSGS